MIAIAARDAGFEVIYTGIRSTPAQLAKAAIEEAVDLVGLSILSGSHLELCEELFGQLARAGASDVPVVVGGIIPEADVPRLRKLGVRRVFSPADYRLTDILEALVDVLEDSRGD
jgi:(2R)-ethylmalonyl-CoA mutase